MKSQNPIEQAIRLYPNYKWVGSIPLFTSEFGSPEEHCIVFTQDRAYVLYLYCKEDRVRGIKFSRDGERELDI